MRIGKLLFLFIFLTSISGCFKIENPFYGLAPGPWRAVLKLEPEFITPNPKGEPLPEKMNIQFDEVSGGELPFTFEVVYTNDTSFYITVKNGEETIKLDQIKYGHNIGNGQDTIEIEFPIFDSVIKAVYEADIMEGKWIARNRTINGNLPYEIKFVARHGRNHRFTTLKKAPMMDISGKWAITFGMDKEKTYQGIGDFVQKGNHLTGTFMTETGDHRYLEGTVQGEKIYLSAFDGSHVFLYEAKIKEDSTLIGSFTSGIHYKTIWTGKRTASPTLTPADQLTQPKNQQSPLQFSFLNPERNTISLSNDKFAGKVKLIELMGTWCPNCRDAKPFLDELSEKFPKDQFEIIGLAFERYRDTTKALQAIQRYKELLEINYEVLWAGYEDKAEASATMSMLTNVEAFPTFLIVDQNNIVQKVFTGFYGPATNQHQAFKQKIIEEIAQLIGNENS